MTAVRELTGDTVGISATALDATLGLLRRDPAEPALLSRTSNLAAATASPTPTPTPTSPARPATTNAATVTGPIC